MSDTVSPCSAGRAVAGAQEIQLPRSEGVSGLGLGVAHIGTMLKTT